MAVLDATSYRGKIDWEEMVSETIDPLRLPRIWVQVFTKPSCSWWSFLNLNDASYHLYRMQIELNTKTKNAVRAYLIYQTVAIKQNFIAAANSLFHCTVAMIFFLLWRHHKEIDISKELTSLLATSATTIHFAETMNFCQGQWPEINAQKLLRNGRSGETFRKICSRGWCLELVLKCCVLFTCTAYTA